MSARLAPHWHPRGWFQIGWSGGFPRGEVRPVRYFGQALVVYRTDDGALHMLHAHWRHLGAHLGYGGTVQNDCVVCPFHGWHWDPDGHNRHIPYQEDRPNKSRRLNAWQTYEHAGVVYMWHDVGGGGPTWSVRTSSPTPQHTRRLAAITIRERAHRSATSHAPCIRSSSARTPRIPFTSGTSTALPTPIESGRRGRSPVRWRAGTTALPGSTGGKPLRCTGTLSFATSTSSRSTAASRYPMALLWTRLGPRTDTACAMFGTHVRRPPAVAVPTVVADLGPIPVDVVQEAGRLR